MDYNKFIQPKDIEIGGRTFSVSKIPAIPSIPIRNEIAKLVSANGVIGLGMFGVELVKSILQYSAVREENGNWKELDTETRINDTFVGKNEELVELTMQMVKENFGFFVDGSLLALLGIAEGVATE